MKKVAQIQLAPEGGFKGFGPLGNPEGSGVSTFSKIISSTIGLLTIIAVVWFVFILITGAIGIMSAGGDKAAMETSRKRISSGVIGIVIVVAAIFILDLIGALLGVPFLDIGELFSLITQ